MPMAKTNWSRTLEEVLKQKTQPKVLVSEKTGNEYTADVVPVLNVVSIGSIEEIDGKFKYSIVDTNNDLEYSIKTPNKVDVKFFNSRTYVVVQQLTVLGGMLLTQ